MVIDELTLGNLQQRELTQCITKFGTIHCSWLSSLDSEGTIY
ncbi:hypothetical protein EBME_0758 [bacterium endosymbiont of Mortierella elongata FMR23-6]|nr:hypothetical protein EBME_0758 [bacterium endosymbiont of Mortierella elongata FMR23-6]